MTTARQRWYLAASLGVSSILLYAIVIQIEAGRLLEILSGVQWSWVAAATVSMFAFQGLRTERTRLLSGATGSWPRLFSSLCVQAVLAKLLPGVLGEAAMVWLLRRLHAVSLERGTATLVVARLMDMALLTLLLVAVLVLSVHGRAAGIGWIAFILAMSVAGLGFVWVALDRRFAQQRVSQQTATAKGIRGRALPALRSLLVALRVVATQGNLPRLATYSLAMWVTMCFILACYLLALGTNVEALGVLVLFAVIIPVAMLPVRGLGNIGTHEAAWFLALRTLDVPADEAAALALGSHVLIMLVAAALTAVGLCGLAFFRETRSQTSPRIA